MKTKIALIILISLWGMLTTTLAQDKSKAMKISKIVWFGVDFTAAKFSFVTEDPSVIVNQYLNSINTVILAEPEKYNIKQFFNKAEVINSIEVSAENNLKIDPSTLVLYSDFKLDPIEVKNLLKKYDFKDGPSTGMVLIAENLNKNTQTGSYYVCFFDIATKEIIDSRRIVGLAKGFGFRNYWAGSIYNVMKTWAIQ